MFLAFYFAVIHAHFLSVKNYNPYLAASTQIWRSKPKSTRNENDSGQKPKNEQLRLKMKVDIKT